MSSETCQQFNADILREAETQRDILTAQLESARAQQELKLLQGIPESIGFGDRVPFSEYPNAEPFDGVSGPVGSSVRLAYATIDDRKDGRYRPQYETETDLARQRAQARSLSAFVSTAIGALESLVNYTIGNGPAFSVDSTDPELQQAAQEFLDDFAESNNLQGGLDREIHNRSREDGEAFVGLYPGRDGIPRLRTLEPEQIREPANPRPLEEWLGVDGFVSSWLLGIHTARDPYMQCDDPTNPLGYHLVFDQSGSDWDYLPADRCEHLKRNVYQTSRRGVSDFLAIGTDIQREAELRSNTAQGAKIQAAIALIRKFPAGTSKSTVSGVVNANAAASYSSQRASGATSTVNVEKFQPGTILNTTGDTHFEPGPMGSLNHPMFIQVAQYLLRSVGIRWSIPEYMISGDASNGNFASTLVDESPFVKAREADQAYYGRHFANIARKAIKMAVESGKFSRYGITDNRDMLRGVDVSCEFPNVATRDKLQQAQTLQIEYQAGIVDQEQWAAETGRDPAKVVRTQPTGSPILQATAEALRISTPEDRQRIIESIWRGAQYP